jgi:glycosyltransferase involved in cell wall biosynthesis
MASGLPVVVSSAGGASELFTDEIDALGVPPGQPQALAQALLRLVNDPSLRAALGQNAVRNAAARFSYLRLNDEVLQVYRSVMN